MGGGFQPRRKSHPKEKKVGLAKTVQPEYPDLSDSEKTGYGHKFYVLIFKLDIRTCPNWKPGRVRVWQSRSRLSEFAGTFGSGQIRTSDNVRTRIVQYSQSCGPENLQPKFFSLGLGLEPRLSARAKRLSSLSSFLP